MIQNPILAGILSGSQYYPCRRMIIILPTQALSGGLGVKIYHSKDLQTL